MKHLILLALILASQVVQAQSLRPNTPYWRLVDEIDRTGLKAYERFNWTDQSLQKILKEVPTLARLASEIGRKKIIYKLGGENAGYGGFTTLLKNGDIYLQIYYAKPLKNIDIALTLGHELNHAYHIDSNLFNEWQSNVKTKKKEYAECVSEMGAYTWSSIYAENQSRKKFYAEIIVEKQNCMRDLSR